MSFPSNRASSQRHRSQSVNTAGPSEYSHPNTALAGPSSQTTTSHPDQRYRHFPTEYIEPSYSPSNPPEGRSPAVEDHTQADFYSATASYYQRQDSSEGTMMMSQRDMNYGYMPAPLHSSMHSYPPGQSYPPQPLAPLPGYYADSQTHRNMSGSSRPSSQPLVDFHFDLQERDAPSHSHSRKRRRTSQSQPYDDRRLAKMRVRRNLLPDITHLSPVEDHAVSGYVDVSPIAPSPSAYLQDHAARSHSRPSISPSYEVSPGPSQYVSPQYHPNYAMGPVNSSNLAPPMSNASYNSGRSSPMLQAPLPPAPIVSPHVEPVVLDRREKPQCWDHGCNGREFSTFSNLLRHQREKSGSAAKSYCPHCGAEFTRTTARNGHIEQGKCKNSRRTSTSNTETSNEGRR